MEKSIQAEEWQVFASCEAVFIFPNAGGRVSIKQYSDVFGNDVIIEIPAHFIEKTIDALRIAKRELKNMETE